jgi:sacsin
LRETLFKGFDEYQGPALYAWNDAMFQKDDWKALAKINQSSKKEDVLKVGRFGLGFLSVFHLTGEAIVEEL